MKTITLLFWSAIPAFAQTLTYEHARQYTLSDRTPVAVFQASGCENCYYYFPTNFRLSVRENGEPEISLLKITETDDGPILGGILHVLTVWGLTNKQETELQELIHTKQDSAGVLLGVSAVQESTESRGLAIVGGDSLANLLRRSLTNLPGVATTPGGKMAMSFRLDADDTKYLLKVLDDKNFKSETRLEILLYSQVEVPGFLGRQQVDVVLQLKVTELLKWLK